MKHGKLFYGGELDRINVSFEGSGYGEGFHCGDVLETYNPQSGLWEERRLEYDHGRDEWYFVGVGAIPVGTEIRVNA